MRSNGHAYSFIRFLDPIPILKELNKKLKGNLDPLLGVILNLALSVLGLRNLSCINSVINGYTSLLITSLSFQLNERGEVVTGYPFTRSTSSR